VEAQYLLFLVDWRICPWIGLFDTQFGVFSKIWLNVLRLAAYSPVLFVLGTDHCCFCIVSRYVRWYEPLVSMLNLRKNARNAIPHGLGIACSVMDAFRCPHMLLCYANEIHLHHVSCSHDFYTAKAT